jgi:hypothetical protein
MTPSATSRTSPLPSPDRRRVLLDEDISRKLAHELRKRGRADATAVFDQGLGASKDGQLFKALRSLGDCVLVTWDNKMPVVHAAELEHHAVTLAVVDRRPYHRRWSGSEDAYVRDVVHRCLHRIETQPVRTVKVYR